MIAPYNHKTSTASCRYLH